ncbi:stage III sporulation protein AA [Marinicrinis sediminis]|uniref:Stage III sporulation protein AA n=1 Tax=Marinicrinis sediminis TaxID=1652465 RepID=A0ABW5RCL2_9BACL
MQQWSRLFPASIQAIIARMPEQEREHMEELRVREGRPLEWIYSRQSQFLTESGRLSRSPSQGYMVSREDCRHLLDSITEHSLYSFEEELKQGFLTVQGGHRIGLCGTALASEGRVRGMKDISSFNIRFAREAKGVASPFLRHLLSEQEQRFRHTLIVSPPMLGKTTLIRDLSRLLSTGTMKVRGFKVSIVDERSEIAACYRGVPLLDVGPRTDVLDRCPKAEGMMMVIRSMSPDILVVDEIGSEQDAAAVREAMRAGIKLLASAHGRDDEDLYKRPALQSLMDESAFERYVYIEGRAGNQLEWRICDEFGTPLYIHRFPANGGGGPFAAHTG